MTIKTFEQKESIQRRLMSTIIIVAFLFLFLLSGFYISSMSALNEITNLHQTNKVFDVTRQVRQSILTLSEIVQKSSAQDLPSKNILNLSKEQIEKSTSNGIELAMDDSELQKQLSDLKSRASEYIQAIESLSAHPNNFEDGALIAKQFEVEAQDAVNRLQINLKAKSDRIFENIYQDRFRPILSGLVLTFIFVSISLFIGLKLRQRLKTSIQNLVDATAKIASGQLNFQAEILHPDEIGFLTDAFNSMTTRLQDSTVTKAYFENVIESMLDSVCVVEHDGIIRSANQVAEKKLGYNRQELIGMQWNQIFANKLSIARGVYDNEVFCIKKDGTKIPVAVAISELNATGQTSEYVCVIEDITARKKFEKELHHKNLALTNANKELEAFSYSVSHDLRAPLRGIDGFSLALVEDLGPALDDEKKDYLNRIRSGVQKMGKLIDDMLNLSKLTRKQMSYASVDLTKMAIEIFDDLKKTAPNRSVELIIKDRLIAVGDEALIHILLENLLNNAWKYTSKIDRAVIEFGIANAEDKTAFFIKDNGAGFDMTYYSKLFGTFQRLHHHDDFPGTGVGLATVQRVVHRHGGSIWAKSEVGKGAAFYFTLAADEVK